jgi:hypothetical protein
MNTSFNRGAQFSASMTIDFMLSGFCARARYVADDGSCPTAVLVSEPLAFLRAT